MGATPVQTQQQQPVVIEVRTPESQGSWAGTALRIAAFGVVAYAAWNLGASEAAKAAGKHYQTIMSRLAGMTPQTRDQAFTAWHNGLVTEGEPTSFLGNITANITHYVPAGVVEFFTGTSKAPAEEFAEEVLKDVGAGMPNVEMPGSETLKEVAAKAESAVFYVKTAGAFFFANYVLKSPVAQFTGKGLSAVATAVSPLARRAAGR